MKFLNDMNLSQFATVSEYHVLIVQERDQFLSIFFVMIRANIVNIENTKGDRART